MIQDFLSLLVESWNNHPVAVVLSVVTIVVLCFVIVDTHRHRRHLKRTRGHHHR